MRDIESLLKKFFDGRTSAEENTFLASVISDEEAGLFDKYCKGIWEKQAVELPSEVKERIRRMLIAQIDEKERLARKQRFKRRAGALLRISAVAAGLLVAVIAGWRYYGKQKTETFILSAERGQKSSLTLPDGSRVILNSASTISYTSEYNSKERNVFLQGEAYFEVAKNPGKAFVVHSQDMSVEALGTKFNIRSYVEDPCIVTTLLEGKVRASAGNRSEILLPEEEASYDKSSGEITKARVQDAEHIVPWIRNELLFTDSSLAEIAVILERMYNVTVIFDDAETRKYTYTGLVRNNSLSNVLELISTTSPVKYRMTANTIKFSKKQ